MFGGVDSLLFSADDNSNIIISSIKPGPLFAWFSIANSLLTSSSSYSAQNLTILISLTYFLLLFYIVLSKTPIGYFLAVGTHWTNDIAL